MFVFFIVIFAAMLMAGVILIAVGWYRMSAEDTEAFDAAQYQTQSEQAKPTRADPVAHLRRKAEEGDARSQFEYGLHLVRQSETYPPRDPNRDKAYSFGATWIKMAAKQSYGPALMYCGDENKKLASVHYERREYDQFLAHSENAMKFYRRAIDVGYPRALEKQEEIEAAGRKIEAMRRREAAGADKTPENPPQTGPNPESGPREKGDER